MSNEFNINDLVDIPVDPITEEIADKYNGTKVKVKTVTPGISKSSYKDGERLPDGQYVEVPVVVVETDVFGVDAKDQPLSIKTNFNLQRMNGKLGFSTSPKSKARKFMKMMKINRIEEAIGRDVVIVKTYFDKSGRYSLVMSIPD